MIDILQGEFLVVFCLTVNGVVDLTQFVMYVTYIKVNDGCHFEFDQADIFQGMKPHILFYGNGLAVCQISGILKLIMADSLAILNLIKVIFFRAYLCLKPHILFYCNGLAIWHGLPDIRHNKVNYGQ